MLRNPECMEIPTSKSWGGWVFVSTFLQAQRFGEKQDGKQSNRLIDQTGAARSYADRRSYHVLDHAVDARLCLGRALTAFQGVVLIHADTCATPPPRRICCENRWAVVMLRLVCAIVFSPNS